MYVYIKISIKRIINPIHDIYSVSYILYMYNFKPNSFTLSLSLILKPALSKGTVNKTVALMKVKNLYRLNLFN